MNIKEYIFNYRLKKQPARQAIFPNYDDIRSIIILFESDYQEKNAVIKGIRDELLAQDKDVVLWGFCAKKDIQSFILPQSRIMGLRDLNIFGCPKQEVLVDLDKRQYDLLLDLTQHPNLPLRYVAMFARASFKAGLQFQPNMQSDGIHDFLIQTDPQDTPHFLYTQIIRYLQMISPKTA